MTREQAHQLLSIIGRLLNKLDVLIVVLERQTSEITGLRLELAAIRERWEAGGTTEEE